MKKIVVAIPHSHSWFWTQTCVAQLKKYPPIAKDFSIDIVVVDNSPWSPAIKGITQTSLGDGVSVFANSKPNKFHASALDWVVDNLSFDYLMAFETDVVPLHADWLQWFVDCIEKSRDYFAVGHWHHEQFVNPSCTIYRGDVLKEMNAWCKANTSDEQRWGENFSKVMKLGPRDVEWVAGAFADKRGWPEGTVLDPAPSGQFKGFGWYEPGQMLHHWAVQHRYNYMECQTAHTMVDGCPVHTIYGVDQTYAPRRSLDFNELDNRGYAAHLWGGTRALDIIKHDVTDGFVKSHLEGWLTREARFWQQAVNPSIQEMTVELIKEHRWHTQGCGTPEVTQRDHNAADYVESIYRKAGIPL